MKNTRPRMGSLCSFAPEEIAMAAGLVPLQLSGDPEEVSMVDAYIYFKLWREKHDQINES